MFSETQPDKISRFGVRIREDGLTNCSSKKTQSRLAGESYVVRNGRERDRIGQAVAALRQLVAASCPIDTPGGWRFGDRRPP